MDRLELLRHLCANPDNDSVTAVARRNVVRDLITAGMAVADVAREVGISAVRVRQMLTGPTGGTGLRGLL